MRKAIIILRLSTLFLAVLLLSCNDKSSDCVAEKHPAPPPANELTEVNTLAELKALKPIHLETGWDVRLGLSAKESEAGPWKLFYCYATYVGVEKNPSLRFEKSFGEPVGPVFLRCRWSAHEHAPDEVSMDMEGAAHEGLYCGLVLLAWEGACNVEVVSRDGKVLRSKVLTIKDTPPCYWQEFAGMDFNAYKSFVRSRTTAAYPNYNGLMSSQTDFKGLDQIDSVLALSLQNNEFQIQSNGLKMVDWPDENLLARWWVNDAPVVPPRNDTCMKMQQGRRVGATELMQVSWNFPDDLGEIKAGDKLKLQVLYCPTGYECLMKTPSSGAAIAMMASETAVPRPLLSNVLEIVVTKELLAARKKEPAK